MAGGFQRLTGTGHSTREDPGVEIWSAITNGRSAARKARAKAIEAPFAYGDFGDPNKIGDFFGCQQWMDHDVAPCICHGISVASGARVFFIKLAGEIGGDWQEISGSFIR